jgi:hypothetical protein
MSIQASESVVDHDLLSCLANIDFCVSNLDHPNSAHLSGAVAPLSAMATALALRKPRELH